MWKINYHGKKSERKFSLYAKYADVVYNTINSIGVNTNLEFDSVELVLEE